MMISITVEIAFYSTIINNNKLILLIDTLYHCLNISIKSSPVYLFFFQLFLAIAGIIVATKGSLKAWLINKVIIMIVIISDNNCSN